jgi:hypothetical protein
MIDNFDEVKKQLRELAEVINAYKSEAVQLRIVDLVFRGIETEESAEGPESNKPRPPKRKARSKRKPPAPPGTEPSRPKSGSRLGSKGALNRLVEEGFFAQPKALADIIKHCETNLARKFKPNDFSGTLARLTRDGVLKRSKNSDGQYEYTS